jgi:hypothetical protein
VDWGALDWGHSRRVERALRSRRTVLQIEYAAAEAGTDPRTLRLGFEEVRELGRMLVGEVSPRTPAQLRRMADADRERYFRAVWDHSAWVIWTVVNRAAGSGGNVVAELHRFSQPLNPDWRRDGRYCSPESEDYRGGRRSNPCSETRLARRERIANLEWSDMDPLARALVLSFAAGHMPSPDARVIDFAVPYRNICTRNGQDVIHRVREFGWNHAFCGNADGRMANLSPGIWATHFPSISRALDPFHGSAEVTTEAGTDPESDSETTARAETAETGTDPERAARTDVALAPEVAVDGELEGLPLATPDPAGLDLESGTDL